MRSRAKLLAELEEKGLKNNELSALAEESGSVATSAEEGYDPYDNPGVHKSMPDEVAFTARRSTRSKQGRRR